MSRLPVLLLASLVGCASPSDPPKADERNDEATLRPRGAAPGAQPASRSMEGPSGARPPPLPAEAVAWGDRLDEAGDRAVPLPFGQALPELSSEDARALFPNLMAAAAPPEELAELLPLTFGGRAEAARWVGVQEDERAAWVGAVAAYGHGEERLWLLVQDTGWEPTQLNPLWGAAEGLARVDAPTGEGVSRQRFDPEHPRVVFRGYGAEGQAAALDAAMSALDVSASKRLAERGTPGPWQEVRSLAVEADLSDPRELAGALPELPGRVVFEGWGRRRAARRDLLSAAHRVAVVDGGVVEVVLMDLGPPGGVAFGSARQGSATELREELGKKSGVGCSGEENLCKRLVAVGSRWVLSAVGPRSSEGLLEELEVSGAP